MKKINMNLSKLYFRFNTQTEIQILKELYVPYCVSIVHSMLLGFTVISQSDQSFHEFANLQKIDGHFRHQLYQNQIFEVFEDYSKNIWFHCATLDGIVLLVCRTKG